MQYTSLYLHLQSESQYPSALIMYPSDITSCIPVIPRHIGPPHASPALSNFVEVERDLLEIAGVLPLSPVITKKRDSIDKFDQVCPDLEQDKDVEEVPPIGYIRHICELGFNEIALNRYKHDFQENTKQEVRIFDDKWHESSNAVGDMVNRAKGSNKCIRLMHFVKILRRIPYASDLYEKMSAIRVSVEYYLMPSPQLHVKATVVQERLILITSPAAAESRPPFSKDCLCVSRIVVCYREWCATAALGTVVLSTGAGGTGAPIRLLGTSAPITGAHPGGPPRLLHVMA